MEKISIHNCWCGSNKLEPFSEHYLLCSSCKTLINSPRYVDSYFQVINDEESYYGKNYWLNHQKADLGLQSILERSRADLSERNIYWLQTLLKYLKTDAKTFEVGFGPGGLIALLNFLGYNSTGIELSDWVVNFVKDIYQVDVKSGQIENASLPVKSFDSIIMLDVIEHLPRPIDTMKIISDLLVDDGFLMIQTPCFKNSDMYLEQLEIENDPFLEMMIDQEHLFLYSEFALKKLLEKIGFKFFYTEPALFAYDIFLVASKNPLTVQKREEVEKKLLSNREGRIVLALIDLYNKHQHALNEAELRLTNIRKLQVLLEKSEEDRAARLKVIEDLEIQLKASEEDRAARLKGLENLENELKSSEEDRAARLRIIKGLEAALKESEEDRAARLKVMKDLELILKENEEDNNKKLVELNLSLKQADQDMNISHKKIGNLENELAEIKHLIESNPLLKLYYKRYLKKRAQ